MRVSKIALLGAIALSASVFAQFGDEEDIFSTPAQQPTFAPTTAPARVATPAPAASNNASRGRLSLRYSGDLSLVPYWNLDNTWTKNGNENKNRGDRERSFLTEYAWNYSMGIDVRDKFSFDFRLSNPSGYAFDSIPFGTDGSGNDHEPEWLPIMPNAFFTWNINDAFKFRGGLLEIKGNTALDVVAAYEDDQELWTSYANWETRYNNSQIGVQFALTPFPSAENELRITAAFPDSERAEGREVRFIVDADIEAGMVTFSPVIHTRVFRDMYFDRDREKQRNSLFWTYGLDVGLEFNETFNLDLGAAFGHITEDRQRLGSDSRTRASKTGIIVKAEPSVYFGINEVFASYSLGFGRDKNMSKFGDNTYRGAELANFSDLLIAWFFRMNDYLAFGPFFASSSSSTGSRDSENGRGDWRSGDNNVRFGLEFRAGF